MWFTRWPGVPFAWWRDSAAPRFEVAIGRAFASVRGEGEQFAVLLEFLGGI
jgi:hypothetical protein